MNNWINDIFPKEFETSPIGSNNMWNPYYGMEERTSELVDKTLANDVSKKTLDIIDSILGQKDRIPLSHIYNAINVVKKIEQSISSIQILSCKFDNEDVNSFDIKIAKRDINLNITVSIYEDDESNIINEAYLLYDKKLSYGSIPNMINFILSL